MNFNNAKLTGLFRTIFITTMLCMLIPVLAISFISIRSFSKSLSAEAKKNLQQLSIEKMNEVDSMIKNQIALTKAVAQSSYVIEDVASDSDGKNLTDYLVGIFKNASGLYENFFITRMEQGIADGLGGVTLHPVNGEPWYEACKKSGEFIGNNISPVTGRPVYVISYGIYDNGRFIGGLNNSIDLAVMTSNITGSITDDFTKVLIIDREGNIIASENSDQILKTNFYAENESTKELISKMRSEKSSYVEFEFNGTRNIGYYSALGTMFTLVYVPESVYTNETTSVVHKVLFAVIICVLVAAVLVFLIALSIIRPISVVDGSIHAIASGDADLTKRITIKAKHEIASLVDGFNLFSQKMQSIIKDLQNSQTELTDAGEKLQNSTYDTESSITQILANITSVNNSILNQATIVEGTTSSIRGISENLTTLEDMINRQNSSVNTASGEVENMLSNINEVNSLIGNMANDFSFLQNDISVGMTKQNDVTALVKEIENQSKTLQEANVVISSIASQTNLLAMNAAIEAAHAGDSGRGFSVVADEIRKLSENSTKQSKKISEQLKSIMNAISNVVNASVDFQNSFSAISERIEITDGSIRQIRSSMDRQQEGSKQISAALQDMNMSTSDVMQSSSEISTESRNILSELQKLLNSSDEMKSSISEMQIGAQKINETGEKLSEISQLVKLSISKNNSQIEKFKV